MVLFTQETYMVLIIHKTILIRLRIILFSIQDHPGLLIIIHSLSQIPIYMIGRETKQERIYKLN